MHIIYIVGTVGIVGALPFTKSKLRRWWQS